MPICHLYRHSAQKPIFLQSHAPSSRFFGSSDCLSVSQHLLGDLPGLNSAPVKGAHQHCESTVQATLEFESFFSHAVMEKSKSKVKKMDLYFFMQNTLAYSSCRAR